ncbi:hypothetical protein BZM27_33040 [Paraburkholderia steynii]|uniref:Uncharacterized protein n=1 Tax=Paraburkholderia steynii TaxID=1245441 RepID=A0A4R0X5T6_9BURK|nr:hypothetical protein BZM27_33040 [Paraburkholderia steynii]
MQIRHSWIVRRHNLGIKSQSDGICMVHFLAESKVDHANPIKVALPWSNVMYEHEVVKYPA